MPKPTDPTHEQPAECVDPNRHQINWDLLLMHSSYSRPDGFDELLIATFLVKHWEEFKSFLEKMPVKMQMECINWIIQRVDRCAWDKARAEFFENMKLVESYEKSVEMEARKMAERLKEIQDPISKEFSKFAWERIRQYGQS